MYIGGGSKQMKDFITALDPNYQLDKYHIKNNVAVFYISSKMSEVKSPYCGTLSSRYIHLMKEIQDLPMQNRKVILLVKTRKMFCSNCKCEKKTFSECHPFVENNGKKTVRLVQNILFTSAQLSSVNAAKILKSNSIEVGKSSICSLLKKMPSIVDKSSVKKFVLMTSRCANGFRMEQ